MGKPLDEPSKILGVLPFGDAVILMALGFLDACMAILFSKILNLLAVFAIFGSILVGFLLVFLLKNMFPKGFFPGLYHHITTPRLKIPGRERSELS